MTHGSGGLSGGGGGGGFSGGGFSMHTHYHSSGSRRSRGNATSGEDCDCTFCVLACVFGINILSFLLCIHKSMSRAARVTLLWCYVIIAVLIVSLALSCGVFGSDSFESSATDMRTVSKVSTLMCDSVTVKSSDSFEAYLLDSEPNINATNRQSFNVTRQMRIGGQQYEYWGFYLLKGSEVNVRSDVALTSSVKLYVIQGYTNLHKWISNNNCRRCYITSISLFRVDTYSLDITESDDYYFVYANSYYGYKPVTAKFRLQRALYDVPDASANCSALSKNSKFQCTFDLTVNSNQYVVYHNGRHEHDDTISMTTSCHARIWLYLILFLLLPAVIGATATVVVWKFGEIKPGREEVSALTFDPSEEEKSYKTITKPHKMIRF